jgi:hypothetical protein
LFDVKVLGDADFKPVGMDSAFGLLWIQEYKRIEIVSICHGAERSPENRNYLPHGLFGLILRLFLLRPEV